MIGSIAQCGLNRWLGEVTGGSAQPRLVENIIDAALFLNRQGLEHRIARELLCFDVCPTALVDASHVELSRGVKPEELRAANARLI
jgi:hypothetical protein